MDITINVLKVDKEKLKISFGHGTLEILNEDLQRYVDGYEDDVTGEIIRAIASKLNLDKIALSDSKAIKTTLNMLTVNVKDKV